MERGNERVERERWKGGNGKVKMLWFVLKRSPEGMHEKSLSLDKTNFLP